MENNFSFSFNMAAYVSVQGSSWYTRVFKKLFTSNSYHKSMQPIFFVTFLYGVTPFRIVTAKSGDKYIRLSYFGYINSLLHILSMAFCYAYTMYYNESVVGYFLENNISNLGNKLYFFGGVVGATVIFISAVVRKKVLIKSFNLLLKADRHFLRIHYSLDYTQILRFVLFVLSTVAVFDCSLTVICVYCLKSLHVYPSPFLVFLVIAEFLGICISISLFCAMARSVQRRVRLLNTVSTIHVFTYL